MEVKKAVFLDKDGTLIQDIPYNVNPDLITLNEGVIAGLHKLKADYIFIVITNQSGIAKGYFDEDELKNVENKLSALLAKEGLHLSGFYYCPHSDEYGITCDCRKPMPGLIRKAALIHQIDLSQSWMIGDILNDVEAGKNAGCKAILIDNGNETEWLLNTANRLPDFTANSFMMAVDFIENYSIKNNDRNGLLNLVK